jgi:hypothetical protein
MLKFQTMFSSFGKRRQMLTRHPPWCQFRNRLEKQAKSQAEEPASPLGKESRPTPLVQADLFSRIQWIGEVPPQKWMNFYTKVVSKFASKGSEAYGHFRGCS